MKPTHIWLAATICALISLVVVFVRYLSGDLPAISVLGFASAVPAYLYAYRINRLAELFKHLR